MCKRSFQTFGLRPIILKTKIVLRVATPSGVVTFSSVATQSCVATPVFAQPLHLVQSPLNNQMTVKHLQINKFVHQGSLVRGKKDSSVHKQSLLSQNKEGIPPVATLSIALYASSKSRSRRNVARGVECCHRHCILQWIASTSKSHRHCSRIKFLFQGMPKASILKKIFYTNTPSHSKHQ